LRTSLTTVKGSKVPGEKIKTNQKGMIKSGEGEKFCRAETLRREEGQLAKKKKEREGIKHLGSVKVFKLRLTT